jgi:hypothetical protein
MSQLGGITGFTEKPYKYFNFLSITHIVMFYLVGRLWPNHYRKAFAIILAWELFEHFIYYEYYGMPKDHAIQSIIDVLWGFLGYHIGTIISNRIGEEDRTDLMFQGALLFG